MSDNEEVPSEVDVPAAVDPYEVLGLESAASDEQIKKAYRKAALKSHPDKVAAEHKDEAHAVFQRIAFAYAILSDPARRKLYDETGSTEETVSADPDWSWTDFYRAQYADVITADAISAFSAKYRHSDEERRDLLKAYTEAEGDMDVVYAEVMLSDIAEDDERFRTMIDQAIQAGEVESYSNYSSETRQKKEKRRKKALKEAKEAEEMAKTLGVHDTLFGGAASAVGASAESGGEETSKPNNSKQPSRKKKPKDKDPEAGLAALIRSRQAGRSNNDAFLDRLAEKYGAKESGKKKRKATSMEEPDDEAFEATKRKLEQNRKRRNG